MKKKPRRRHKKGKGSPGGLGPSKKSPGNSSMAATRTETAHSMHLSASVAIITSPSSQNEFVFLSNINLSLNFSHLSLIYLHICHLTVFRVNVQVFVLIEILSKVIRIAILKANVSLAFVFFLKHCSSVSESGIYYSA